MNGGEWYLHTHMIHNITLLLSKAKYSTERYINKKSQWPIGAESFNFVQTNLHLVWILNLRPTKAKQAPLPLCYPTVGCCPGCFAHLYRRQFIEGWLREFSGRGFSLAPNPQPKEPVSLLAWLGRKTLPVAKLMPASQGYQRTHSPISYFKSGTLLNSLGHTNFAILNNQK